MMTTDILTLTRVAGEEKARQYRAMTPGTGRCPWQCARRLMRFAVVMCSVSSMCWLVAGVGDTTNHADSGTPSERYRYTVARDTPWLRSVTEQGIDC